MKVLKTLLLGLVALVVFGALSGAVLIWRGFRATATPSAWETAVARTMRNLAIPGRARSEKNPFVATPSEAARGRRIVSDPVRFLSWNRRQREDAGGAPSLSESTGPARGGNPETHGRRTPLHHRKRSPAYGDAWLGEPTHRVGRRELEACSFSPELPAAQPRRAVATSDDGRFDTLHRIAGLREVPRGYLYPLEEDADGERGARSFASF